MSVSVKPLWLLAIPLAACLLFLLAPLMALFVRAFANDGIVGMGEVVQDPAFLDALSRTLLLSVIVTVLCIVVGTVYALTIVIAPRWLGAVLLVVLLASFWLSLIVRTFGWVLLFQPAGALDQLLQSFGLAEGGLDLFQTTPAMYPAMVHVMLPFFVIPLYAACLRLDADQVRAGQSLGARPLSVLWRVILPQLRPSILGSASLVLMLSLAFYITPLLIGGPSQLTIATLIDRQFNTVYDIAGASQMAVILLVAVLALYLVADRFVSLVPLPEEDE